MRKKRKGVVLLLLFLLLILPGKTVFADGIDNEILEENGDRFGTTSPWLSGTQDNSIYENSIDTGEEDQDISAKTPGRVEKYIAELIRNIASALIALLQDTIGASIDSIIYGRVGSGHPNAVNIYAFELRKGNPYGVTASVCYALLRGMMFIFLGVSFVFQLAKAAWSGQTAKSREEIKGILPMLLMKFCVLMLMPYLLDVALYIRDVLLYGIKEVTGQMVTGGATLSLSKAFLMNAERSGTFVDAAMYLGTVVLTIYFVFLYVAVAIDMLVCFVSFPFVCVFHSRKKDLINGWVSTVFSNLMTPVIDAVLLLVPLLTSLMLSDVIRGVSVIQLVMCMLIIPARVRLKALLGIQSNERNGFLGAMAVMTLARTLASRIKQGAGKIAEAMSDVGKSHMHGELAEVDREEEEALLSGGSSTKERQETPAEDSGRQQADIKDALLGEEDVSVADSMDADAGELQPDSMDADAGELRPDSMEASSGERDTNISSGGKEMFHSGAEIIGNTKGDVLREIGSQVDRSQNMLDGLRMERSTLVQKDKQLKRQMLDCKRGTEEYKQLEKERANVESQTAEIDSKIAKESGKLNRLRRQSKEFQAALGMHIPTRFDEKRAEILRKRANIDNFEQPEFKGVLTNDQMRVLYRNRAIAKAEKAVAGTVGAVAGGAVAGSASVFLGGSGSAMAAAGGLLAGGSAGEAAVDLSVGAARVVKPTAAKVGKAAYHAADMAASAYLMQKIRPAAMQVPLDMGRPLPPQQDDISSAVAENVETVADMPESGYKAMDVMTRVVSDAQNVITRAMSPKGNARSSSMLRMLQLANIEIEREIAVLREEGVALTEEAIRNKRISVQENMLTEQFMAQLEYTAGYQKDTEEYVEAEKLIREKIGALLAERDKPMI